MSEPLTVEQWEFRHAVHKVMKLSSQLNRRVYTNMCESELRAKYDRFFSKVMCSINDKSASVEL